MLSYPLFHPAIRRNWCSVLAVLLLATAHASFAAGAPEDAKKSADAPDVIVFTNGDQLSGKLLRSVAGKVTFHSDIAGDVTVSMDKVKSIHSSQQFAVIREGQKVGPHRDSGKVPQGTLQVTNGDVAVSSSSGAVQQIPAKDASYLIDEKTFQTEVMREPSFFYGWNGSVTLGATQVSATQSSKTYTGAVTLVRIIPTADWLDPRNKTSLNLNATYGLITQPAIPGGENASSAKTNILHGDLEHDHNIGSRAFLLVDASADHNLGSGLQLQQTYGGGAGATVYKSKVEQFDLKGDIHYQQQQFYSGSASPNGTPNVNLIGANLSETYLRKLPRGLLFNELGTYSRPSTCRMPTPRSCSRT